ncbi:MAG: hypothetical protein K2K32_03045 [Muribaculaceae bacterium]|nr:hypothetical protein [Muribaculaceae bacterium]
MKYDDDRYLGEDDDELWDDELDISADVPSDDAQDYYAHSSESVHSGWHQDADNYNAEDSHINYSDTDYSDADDSYTDYSDSDDSDTEDYYSSEPEPAKPKRDGFFSTKVDDREEENDFFTSDAEPVVVKKSKAPALDPEDPDYWIEEESELENIIHKTKNKWKWWLGSVLTLLLIILVAWIWFFRPYVDDAVKYGYIKNMERRGSIVKTFEGSMIPYKELGDPNPMYFEEVRFSVESDSLAARMKRMMLDCVPVRLEYQLYHSSLPWKGDEKMIITKVDSADVNKILPPDYRYYK